MRRTGTEADTLSSGLIWSLKADPRPCVTLGAWKAYAGEEEQTYDGPSPRARVRRAVEGLLRSFPEARLVLTGHSLGGALSTIAALDLIAQSEAVRKAAPLTLLNFAAPRMFNQAFQDVMSALELAGSLHALRVVVGADMIARIPPKQLGGVHGVRPRLVLDPNATEGSGGPCRFTADDPDDAELWRIKPADVHICHALYLGGEATPSNPTTVPKSVPWPLTMRLTAPLTAESES